MRPISIQNSPSGRIFKTFFPIHYRRTSTMASTQAANDFLDFVNASPTPYHAVHEAKERLDKAGFAAIKEKDSWGSKLKPGGKYYVTRNTTSIIAFAIGEKWKPGNAVGIVGTHTDSCCLRIKPVSKKQNDGFLQIGVETYGGGLWHTWFDRDLSLAGRVMVKDDKGGFIQKLIKINRPLLRIPTLAIHLDRQEKFEFNKENQLFPIAGLVAKELDQQFKSSANIQEEEDSEKKTSKDDTSFAPLKALSERHHPQILEIIASEAGVEPGKVVDFEVVLYDVQPSVLGGLNNEFIFSARLDNLEMTYCAIAGIIASTKDTSALKNDSTIRMIACFDHEEIGSRTAQGADSNFLPAVLKRLSSVPGSKSSSARSNSTSSSNSSFATVDADDDLSTTFEQTLAQSFLVSADMAHSVHPNYAGKYESSHRPAMNGGPVIKINANARYATNSPGITLVQEVARRSSVPLQLFVVRNDSSCGSTIGPMLSAALGARTLDLGNPQLSMHSIRETGGRDDVLHGIRLFEGFFEHFGEVGPRVFVD